MATTRERNKAAYNFNVELGQMVRRLLKDMSEQQMQEVLTAYSQLMRPTEQKEMTVDTAVLAQMALLASRSVSQEMVHRYRGV